MGTVTDEKTPPLEDNTGTEGSALDPLTEDDEKEIALFIENSQKYCEKIYGRTFEDEDEIEPLRKKIKQGNEAAKQIKAIWGITCK
jgi:hypothetical protein